MNMMQQQQQQQREGVQKTAFYDRATAAVLRFAPAAATATVADGDENEESSSAGVLVFHLYAIRYGIVEPGLDAMQADASDFALLAPTKLDDEVGRMCVKLFLPLEAVAEARLTYYGTVLLDSDKVNLMRKFNVWIFSLILGRIPPAEASPEAEVAEKHYYVLPVKAGQSCMRLTSLLDWDVAECALESGLVYRKQVQPSAVLHHSEESDEDKKGSYLCRETVKMLNGNFSRAELVDTVVTSMYRGVPCYVTSTSTDISGSCIIPRIKHSHSMSYTDYFSQKCRYKLKHEDQPFLEAYKLSRAVSFLGCHQNRDVTSGVRNLNQTRMQLPPEICLVHRGLQGQLYRGAVRLPSVLYSLEMSLLAAELRDKADIPISYVKVLEALTSGACSLEVSYEQYELLGDSFLKFTGGVQAFFDDHSRDAEKLGVLLHDLVCNKTLFHSAVSCGLFGYIQAEIFSPSKWSPPGFPLINEHSDHVCVKQKKLTHKTQLLSYKTLADVVEALIGTCVINGNLQMALKIMGWLKVPIQFPPRISETFPIEFLSEDIKCNLLFQDSDIEILAEKLGYCFRKRNLLAAALSASSENSLVFQRLEFLGDAILDYLITRHIVSSYPYRSLLELNNLKQATNNREHFSYLAVHHGLHKFMRDIPAEVEDQISEFEKSLIKEHSEGKFVNAFGIARQSSPKVLGDVVQTLAAAILLDSGLDAEVVWQVYKPLLEPLATPETVSLHPTKHLELYCTEKGWQFELQCVPCDGIVQVNAVVNNVIVGSSQNEEKRVARRLAAMKGLQRCLKGASSWQVFPNAVNI
ncbi:hypothetical protein O6H91_06G085000 [Diphasiastrum complanatum]|uniref:Uncharacterized protein n=1 Tax=Diphasiastrum complanatum TaxID=34168 RepID=A0ACC2DFQ2_DIPCM|nr:hypothetical protein O6H91_06G085000 [Diphasiastrum complanatum]